MKVGLIVGAVIGVIVLLILLISVIWSVGTYNSLVSMDEDVDASWAQVENQYERKLDLIPDLLEAVEGYKEFEESTLTNITSLRSQWMEASGNEEDQLEISNQIDTTLKSIILTIEAYPDLQSIDAVRDFMVSLEGAENRITVERMRYNDDVRDFNKKIKQFPSVIIANMFDFEERSYFESSSAPENP